MEVKGNTTGGSNDPESVARRQQVTKKVITTAVRNRYERNLESIYSMPRTSRRKNEVQQFEDKVDQIIKRIMVTSTSGNSMTDSGKLKTITSDNSLRGQAQMSPNVSGEFRRELDELICHTPNSVVSIYSNTGSH
jgi:hypothetical protein